MYKPFNNKKHFLSLVTKCCEARVQLLTRPKNKPLVRENCELWLRVNKKELREIDTLEMNRIEYNLHTHLVPKGGVLYIREKQPAKERA